MTHPTTDKLMIRRGVAGAPFNRTLARHTYSKIPRTGRGRGLLVAPGLDTVCVYGGKLTAYSPVLDEFVQVDARGEYAKS